jgi:hypothetical protein
LGGFVGEQYGKAIWSNFPVSDVPRPGLQLGSLNSAQRALGLGHGPEFSDFIQGSLPAKHQRQELVAEIAHL